MTRKLKKSLAHVYDTDTCWCLNRLNKAEAEQAACDMFSGCCWNPSCCGIGHPGRVVYVEPIPR